MTEGRGFHKFALAFVQSLPVLVVAYLFSFVTETEIHSNTILTNFEIQLVLRASHQFFELLFGGEVLPLPPGDGLFSSSSDSCPLFNELLH